MHNKIFKKNEDAICILEVYFNDEINNVFLLYY